jgi:hypothetical protein
MKNQSLARCKAHVNYQVLILLCKFYLKQNLFFLTDIQ